ncbi:hypothetical protein B0A50_05749 [Salinomyces thailandicus]|uniref:RRM domain-containing protein n=1 Tax=Salinomyces thailandicus TaxID=706561 RepID=A0A4U0TRH3_9PEZI|nr:hypothetical protein B0A50_05749 [Salinomyces thailandica]
MSATTITKKRKSAEGAASATKKVKTAKSAEKPAPRKSAMKTSKDKAVVAEKKKPGKAEKAVIAEKGDQDGGAEQTVAAELVEDDAEGGAELTADQTAALLAGFSSSEDEADDADEVGVAVEKLPQAPRMKNIQRKIKQATFDDPERTPGVIYIGRLPHGFYEPQLRGYFSQFGEILHQRLARNRKTGKSQHYAFIEFASKAVAEIVAKTMDKYLLFGHILQVRTVPREQVKENIFDASTRRKKPAPRNRLEGGRLKRGMERDGWERKIERESKRRQSKADALKELGYEFEMPDVKPVSEVPVKPKEIEAGPDGEDAIKEIETKQVEAVITPAPEEPSTEVTRTVESKPEGVTIMEKKVTKKRSPTDGKAKKAKKVKT